MGCYNCGSSEGGPHVLCPQCNAERHETKEIRRLEMRGIDVTGARKKEMISQILFLAIVGIFAVGIYVVLFAPGGPEYGVTIIERYLKKL